MSRADRRRKGGGGVGRDQLFRILHVRGSFEREAALVHGLNTRPRGKEAKGGNKRGSWGPEGDGEAR